MYDRMAIYFFIAASHTPWVNLHELGSLASHVHWFSWLMEAGGTMYVFLYHEKPSDVNQSHILPRFPDMITSWSSLSTKH